MAKTNQNQETFGAFFGANYFPIEDAVYTGKIMSIEYTDPELKERIIVTFVDTATGEIYQNMQSVKTLQNQTMFLNPLIKQLGIKGSFKTFDQALEECRKAFDKEVKIKVTIKDGTTRDGIDTKFANASFRI